MSHLVGNVNMETLKLCGNKITNISELECLKVMTKLKVLDLIGNTIEGFSRDAVFAMFPSLEVLDATYKDNTSYHSMSDDEEGEFEMYEEGGEDELEEDLAAQVENLEKVLSDKQKKQLADAGVTIEAYLKGEGPDLDAESGDESEDGDAAENPEEAKDGDDKKPHVN